MGCVAAIAGSAIVGVAIAAICSYFGMLGLCLVAGIVFLILSSAVMKMPEVRAKHRVLCIVCKVLGVLLILFAILTIILSAVLLLSYK